MARPPALTRTRARQIARLNLRGASPEALAEAFNVFRSTVDRALAVERERSCALGLDGLLEQFAAEPRER